MKMSFVIWLLGCVFVGYCANCKGRSGVGWGAASMFFTPIIVGIVLALMPNVVKKRTLHHCMTTLLTIRDVQLLTIR